MPQISSKRPKTSLKTEQPTSNLAFSVCLLLSFRLSLLFWSVFDVLPLLAVLLSVLDHALPTCPSLVVAPRRAIFAFILLVCSNKCYPCAHILLNITNIRFNAARFSALHDILTSSVVCVPSELAESMVAFLLLLLLCSFVQIVHYAAPCLHSL